MLIFTLRDPFRDEELQALASYCPELDTDAVQTSMSFLGTSFDVLRNYEAFLTRYNLSIAKVTILIILWRNPDKILTPSECAECANLSRGTLTGVLEGLERQGLMHREPHPFDKRMSRIQLSEKGRQLLERVLPEYFERTAMLMSALSTREKRSLRTLMDKLRSRLA